jgi:uncharacterized protein (DUF885 family)
MTLDRRRLLFSAAAGAALSAAGQALALPQSTPAAAPAAPGAQGQLNALMDRIFREMLLESPETLTGLGMDKGPMAAMKSKLDDRSQAKIDSDKADFRKAMTDLAAINRSELTGASGVHYDTLKFFGDTVMTGYDFKYGGGFFPSPYTVSQLGGSYQGIPDFLDSQHSIETADDAEAYLSRLEAFGTALDQETERMRADFAAGAVPPDFIIAKTLTQMASLTDTPVDQLTLVSSIARRTGEKNLSGDWKGRAEAIVNSTVLPALNRQVAALKAVQPQATHDAGVWRLPDGAAYYDFGIRMYTTTTMSGDEIHQMGLEQLAELSSRADAILKAQGMTQGTVGERISALGKDPRFVYPNTDEAKEGLLQDLNAQIVAMEARLPEYFGRIPKSPVEVKRVPKAIEAGAPGGYYNSPALDGSRPGYYYINLRDTAEWPKWTLPTLSYHEATPGHHHQIALQQENDDAPMLMKVMGFSAYSEGWGLYAEQLADEMGVYADDPFGQIGYLQSMMFRATRLVVDSGLHHKRWTREQAIRFMVDAIGDQESSVTTEIERYCVWPGQAASYKVGHTTIVQLREDAKRRLGSKFDIKGFHDTLLGVGGVPLEVLRQVMNDWTVSQA